MAFDESLLDRYLATPKPTAPTLRLYGWRPATLSLGKAQTYETSCSPGYLRDQGIGLVRRPTGGQAVLHEFERTYAVIGRLDQPPFQGGVLACYEAISEALSEALGGFGFALSAAAQRPSQPLRDRNPVCFAEPSAHELLGAEKKFVGSAQLRRRQAFLQHGSILLRSDAERLHRAIGVAPQETPMIDLERLTGRTVGEDEVDTALIAGFKTRFEATFEEREPSVDEGAAMTRLRTYKYLSEAWTLRGEYPR